jgi:hypothetical protein
MEHDFLYYLQREESVHNIVSRDHQKIFQELKNAGVYTMNVLVSCKALWGD